MTKTIRIIVTVVCLTALTFLWSCGPLQPPKTVGVWGTATYGSYVFDE